MELIDELVAERDIRRLVASYAQLADDAAVGDWSELFTAHGVLDTGNTRAVGREALRNWLVSVLAGRSMRHLVSNVAVTVDSPTTATGRMDLLLLGDHDGRWAVSATMRYADRYQLVDGSWLFAERVLTPRMPPRLASGLPPSPTPGATMTAIPLETITEPDLDTAAMVGLLDRQRRAFRAEGPPTLEVRLDRIRRLTLALLENADELAAALNADFGNRPAAVSLSSDVLGSLPGLPQVQADLADWMADQPISGSEEKGMPTFVQHRPKGVVGVIGPWNFPVNLTFLPALEALAAGNRVMIKFSEIPARTAEVFARAVAAHLSPEEVVVVRGGAETSAAFAALPFNHLFFTGSAAVGRHVAAAAGTNLVPVTLELGGKNPVVVARDADLPEAARRIAAQRMMNGGQLCLCPDYVFVPQEAVGPFVDHYAAAMATYFPTYLENPDVVTIVNSRNFERVTSLIDDARTKGAEVRTLAPDDELGSLPDPATRRIPPTVLLGVTDEMDVAHEEVFGPVITVLGYDDVRSAIDYVNARPHPLASYWYGEESPDFHEFLRLTTSGGVTRGDMALHFGIEGAPFGGVGQSGSGAYHGKVGFDTFSHQRTVTQSALPFGVAPRSMPPFKPGRLDGIRETISKQAEALRG
jgi:coniferyl-aldehyde dehydrogenase